MVTREAVLEALSTIIDPDFQKDIVSLGFIKDLEIEGTAVGFSIELTTPACPVKERFRQAAESAVSALDGVDSVAVTMTARQQRAAVDMAQSGLKGVGTIVAISSCKGGVGKSTIAAMLAAEVAARGFKVGLLDADIYGPSVPTLFDLHDVQLKATPENFIIPEVSHGVSVVSFGFLVKGDPAVMRGPMVSQLIQQLLHQVAWGELDYLFIDMPPGTGDIQLTISQAIQIHAALIVTLPHQLSLADVGKGILMFDKVSVPVLGVVENMAYFICDGCNKKHYPFGRAGADMLESKFGVKPVAELPMTDAMAGPLDGLMASGLAHDLADDVIMALGKETLGALGRPAVEFNGECITLSWADGETVSVRNHSLRAACGCAVCVDEMSGEARLDPDSIPDSICAMEARVVGNYAISVKWSDGHETGLYPYRAIRELADRDMIAPVSG